MLYYKVGEPLVSHIYILYENTAKIRVSLPLNPILYRRKKINQPKDPKTQPKDDVPLTIIVGDSTPIPTQKDISDPECSVYDDIRASHMNKGYTEDDDYIKPVDFNRAPPILSRDPVMQDDSNPYTSTGRVDPVMSNPYAALRN